MKWFLRVLYSVSFLAFLSLVSLFVVDDTFAVEDLVYTFDTSSPSNQYICGFGNTPLCSSFSYVFIESSVSDSVCNVQFLSVGGSQINRNVGYFTSGSYLLSTDSFSAFRFNSFQYDCSSYSGFVTVTLSENNPYSSGIIPSGSLSITENGTYDVTQYAQAVVDVPTSSGGAGGGTDVSEIVKALYTLGGVILVVYFFYCIYRMIIKPLRS